jgi:hypothetical protein
MIAPFVDAPPTRELFVSNQQVRTAGCRYPVVCSDHASSDSSIFPFGDRWLTNVRSCATGGLQIVTNEQNFITAGTCQWLNFAVRSISWIAKSK